MALLHQAVEEITERIRARSISLSNTHLACIEHAVCTKPVRNLFS